MAGHKTSASQDGLPLPSTTSSDGSTPGATHTGAGTGPRTARACTQCSVKKRRCDGGQPICSVCSALGIQCSYNTNPLRRGPPKGFRADPQTSAKARLMRKLETTIRDLVAQFGKEQAAREVVRVSLERGIDGALMDLAKAEPGVEGGAGLGGANVASGSGGYGGTEHDSEYEGGRSPKRARTDGPAGGLAHVPLHQHPTFGHSQRHEQYPGSAGGTPQTQHVALRPAGTASYGHAGRNSGPPYPLSHPHPHQHQHQHQTQHPHPHPLAHLAHEASMLRRAQSSAPQPGPHHIPPYHVKSQEEDDEFLGVTERGDLVHRGSSSGIGLLNRTHTQIQQHGQQVPYSMTPFHGGGPDRSSQYVSSPGSDRTSGHGPGRVSLPPISTIHGGPHQLTGASPMGMSGTVPLPLPPGPGYHTHHAHPAGSGPSAGTAYPSPAGYPTFPLYANSARSSPAPYDERGRAAFGGPVAQLRPLSTDRMRERSPPSIHHDVGSSGMSYGGPHGLPENRPYRRLKDEHRMSSLSPAHQGPSGLGPSLSPRRRWSERSDDERGRARPEEARSFANEQVPGAVPGKEGLPRVDLTQEEKSLLFKYYYSDFHPFWPVLFKPALDAIPMDQLPDRLDEVLLYAIWTMGSAVMPNIQHETKQTENGQEDQKGTDAADDSFRSSHDGGNRTHSDSERATIARLRSLTPTFFACAEAHLFASRLRPTVSTIQCLFLLSLYSHGCGELSRAWVYSGLACAMLLDLGLHRWPIHRIELLHESAERETRTRLIWCVYILDKVLSAEMGRPVILRATDCDAPFLSEVEADELEPWSGSVPGSPNDAIAGETTQYIHAPSCLNWGIRLFQIVEKILSSVHAFRRKAQLRRNANAHHILVEIDKELDRWKAALPGWLSLERLENTRKAGEAKDREQRQAQGLAPGSMEGGPDGSRTQASPFLRSRPLPSFFLLHLWYFTSTLLLHRPFIPQDEGALLSEVLANESHRKCTEAANTICDLVESSSTPVDRLSTDLAYCIFTAAVLQLFNARLADTEIASAARRRLNLCRQWLKQLSETWPAASAHRQLLDGFSMVGQGAMEDTEVQLGLEAAAVAVVADADAAAAASALGNVGGNGMDSTQDGMATAHPSGPVHAEEPGMLNLGDSVSAANAHSVVAVPSAGLRPLDQHSGSQLRNPANGGTGAGSNTSPSILAMPGSGRLLMFNGSGSSPLNIPVSSISRSPFFSHNTGKNLPAMGGNMFLLDGGGSALGTASGPVTAQQRAQMAQYQAYMASFQSRYANTMAGGGGGPGGVVGPGGVGVSGPNSSSLILNDSFGNAGNGVGSAMPMSSVGTWMVPNTSMLSMNSNHNGGMGGQQLAAPQAPAPKVPLTKPTLPIVGAENEIMTPMRLVHADAQAHAQGAPRDVDFGGLGGEGSGMDSSASMTMPSVTADAPVGLWDIENFFWNERSAGATSGNFTYMSNNLPEPALEQTGPGVGGPARDGSTVVGYEGRSTPSTVSQQSHPLPSNGNSNIGAAASGPNRLPSSSGAYVSHGFTTSGSGGPAASFHQLYNQVHSRKMSNNSTGLHQGHDGNGGTAGPDGTGPTTGMGGGPGPGHGPTHSAGIPPTDGLSMLADVTAGGGGLDRSAVAVAGPGGTGANSSGGPISTHSAGPMTARLSTDSLPAAGTPMLGVQPSRRMTPLVGSGNPPSGGFTYNPGNGMGTPSFGGTGNTPLFNIGMGLGMSSSGSNLGMGGGGGMGSTHGNSIISLSPFGFSMTPDPVVWDALALLELPPSFAKV